MQANWSPDTRDEYQIKRIDDHSYIDSNHSELTQKIWIIYSKESISREEKQ
jgi:hypothetical protein